ncbi:unnamed protein product [Diamesa serratosioi]
MAKYSQWWKVGLVLLQIIIIIECANISPKLDFEELDVKKDTRTAKIKGLRVTVDTSELKESKSSNSDSSSSSDSKENKKTVGVRTDVTFEISSGEVNDTKVIDEKEIGKDDDNASIPIVPVFKGTPDKTNNPAGNRNKPGSNPGFVTSKESDFNDIWSVRPLSPGPIFHPTDDEHKRYGGVLDDNWSKVPQFGIWTTERYNRRFDQPVYHHRGYHPNPGFHSQGEQGNNFPRPYEPCTCKEYPGPYIKPHQDSGYHPTQKIDDKLEKPFSKTS